MKRLVRVVAALVGVLMLGQMGPLGLVGVLAVTPAAASGQSVSAAVGGPLGKGRDLAKAGNYAGALKQVKQAAALPGKTAYEGFIIDDFLAYIYLKTGNYGEAIHAYERALKSGMTPANSIGQRIQALATLNYQTKNYPGAIAYASRYLKEVGPAQDMQLLVMQCQYLQKNYASAGQSARALSASAMAAGRPPQENWLQIEMASAYKLKDREAQTEALTKRVRYYPSRANWNDLLSLNSTALGGSDAMGLEIARLKMATGNLMTSDDYIEMSQLAIQRGLPGEAERVMEQGYKVGILGKENRSREQRLIAMAKQQSAQDRPSLQSNPATAKAKAASAEAYASYDEIDRAVSLYQAALKEGAPNQAEIYLHLGQAQLSTGQKSQALQSFAKVPPSDRQYASLAALWTMLAKQQ